METGYNGRMAKKRGHGEGSIYRRGETWRAQVTVAGRRLSHAARTRREAQEWIRKTMAQAERGLTYDRSKVTLGDYLEQWLASIKSAIRPATYRHYEILAQNHLIPALGNIIIRGLTADLIQRTYDTWIRDGMGVPTVRKAHGVLHQALERAVQTGLLVSNPAKLVTQPKSPYKEMAFWTEGQANQFLAAARDNRLYALFHLAIVTGARQSELLALQWADLDLKRGTLHIRRQLDRSGAFMPVKTRAGNRTLQLGQETLNALRERIPRQQLERQFAGRRWQEHDLIFTSTIGTPLHQKNLVDRYFLPLVEQAGVPRIRFHDLRHTAVAIMLSRGVPVFTVSKWLGHSSPSITSDIYGHLVPGAADGIGQLMDELVAPVEIQIEADNF